MSGRRLQYTSDKVFNVCNYGFLIIVLISVTYPLIYIISSSFSSPTAVASGWVYLWPVEPGIKGYTAVFENKQVLTGYYNSLIYTVFGTMINIGFTIMAAYPLSRGSNVIMGSKFIMFFYVFTMLFSGGLIPNYILIQNLGLYNTRWALMLPNAISIWNVIITRTFFKTTVPNELYEVSELEGASEFRKLFMIVLPLSGTIVAVNALFYAVGHWNAYFNALIYLKDAKLFPLQIILRNILIINQVDSGMLSTEQLAEREGLKDLLKYSLIIVASAPVLIIYPFVQKYFIKGVMIGSIKG